MTSAERPPKPPEPLPSPIRLILALASLCATTHLTVPPKPHAQEWFQATASLWLKSVCKLLSFDLNRLPSAIGPESVKAAAEDTRAEWSAEEIGRMGVILVEASLAMETGDKVKKNKEEVLKYTPVTRALSYRVLELLGLPAKELLPEAEKNISSTLFSAFRAAAESENQDKVEGARQAQLQGWGGSLGRHLATGAGVIAGGVLVGITGGLAAPAIAAVLAPLGIGTILSASAAPVVLGTLFGVGGGGLAGRRVRERWTGVEEFSFIEVGDGHKATQEEIDDLRKACKKIKEGEEAAEEANVAAERTVVGKGHAKKEVREENYGEISEEQVQENEDRGRLNLEQRLLNLTLQSDTRTSISSEGGAAAALARESPRASLDQAKEEKDLAEAKKPPSLTATIVVPGLLTVSPTEAISTWRAICSSTTNSDVTLAPRVIPRHAGMDSKATAVEKPSTLGVKDGRDVYLLRFESAAMLKTGRDVDLWVESKLKVMLKKEIIKRTLLNAYFAAVSLPLSVYSMATMTLDNTWMHAQDRAKKAGRLLGEVIEKRVQGERPVILIGSSVGALTVHHALLYLASLPPPPPSKGPVPSYVESAYMISLPAAPSQDEWEKCRSVVGRRLVNAWSDADLVLAGVVRLHEVMSRAAVMSSGIRVAGLGPVEQPGVEDVDVSLVLRGHMEMQAKMPEILRVIDVDA